MFVTLVVVCFISATFADANKQWVFHTRSQTDEKCEKAFTLVWNGLEKLMAVEPMAYMGGAYFAEMVLQLNISNPDELKPFVCKITNVKNLRELYDTVNMKGETYNEIVVAYKGIQVILGQIGGYTNVPRAFLLAKDILGFVEEAPGIKPDLATLERFFEVMQVKYGSRWLSLLATSKNQMVLVEDPEDLAKKLHACTTMGDVAKLLNIKERNAKPVYTILLKRIGPPITRDQMQLMELMVQGIALLGETGLLTLEY